MARMETNPALDQLWKLAQERFNQSDIEGAKAACESMLVLDPLNSRAHVMLGDICHQRDQHRLATQHALRAAAKMGKQSLQHIAGVSSRLITLGEYEQAVGLIRKIDPAKLPAPAFLVEFSQQLSLLEQHEEALRFMDAAIRIGAKAESVSYLRGNYLKFLGRLDEAALEYERSLATNPNFAYAHWALAYLGAPGDPAHRVGRIRKAIDSTAINHPDLAYLSYALFKELDALGDTDLAWKALEAGFHSKRTRVKYDAQSEAALFEQLAQVCGPGFIDDFAAGAATEAPAHTPIFVLGMPRTGTTLLERILGGHGQITLCGELNDFRMQFKWASDHHSLGVLDSVGVERIPDIDFGELGRRYLQHVAWRAPDTAFFSDKNPSNFMLVGLILRALPHAKIIHLRRDPMDSCFSNLKELFAANSHPYSYDFADLAGHFRNYSKLMGHWHSIAPGRILDVNYEDLVSDPETAARRVMSYCGLSYDAGQIRMEANATPVSTASSAQVRQPIHSRNVGGWKRYAAHLEPLQKLLEDAAP